MAGRRRPGHDRSTRDVGDGQETAGQDPAGQEYDEPQYDGQGYDGQGYDGQEYGAEAYDGQAYDDPDDEPYDDRYADSERHGYYGGERLRAARRRRHRLVRTRHAVVFLIILALVFGGAGYAVAYYKGWLGNKTVAASCRPVKALPDVPARLIDLNVYNASSKIGIAQSVASELQRRGFHIIGTGDDPLGATVKGSAQVRYGPMGAAVAQTVAREVPGATLDEDGRTNPTVDLVIGSAFKQLVEIPPPAAKSFTLNVYNTTYRTGLAGDVAKLLKARGFKIGAVSNDPERSFVTGVAVLRYGPNGTDTVRRVALQLKGAKLLKDGRKGTSVDLVLGAKYHGLVSASRATPPPVAKSTVSPIRTRTCSRG